MGDAGFVHFSVNHSVNFVDPESGAHTQNIERSWREVRSNVPRYGRSEQHYAGYLCEFLWKRTIVDHRERVHELFATLIAKSRMYDLSGVGGEVEEPEVVEGAGVESESEESSD